MGFVEKSQEKWGEFSLLLCEGASVSLVKWLGGSGAERRRPERPGQGVWVGGEVAGGRLHLTGRALGNDECKVWGPGLRSHPPAEAEGL